MPDPTRDELRAAFDAADDAKDVPEMERIAAAVPALDSESTTED